MKIFDTKVYFSIPDTPLPHNFIAEKLLLSCLLKNSEVIDNAIKTLGVETFYFINHQEIYKAISEMYKKKIPINVISVYDFLKETGCLDKVGGANILLELFNQTICLEHVEKYIQSIQERFLRRSLIQLGYETINSAYLTNIPLEIILRNFEKKSSKLANQSKNEQVVTSADLFSTIFSEIKQKALKPDLPGLASGFYDLDSLTQGFQKSDLIILAGRPSMGKTALSLNIIENIMKNYKLPVIFFSLEMSKEQLIYRLLSNETGINQARLKNGNLYKEDWYKLNLSIQTYSCLPLFIEDQVNITVQDIRSKIKNMLLEQNKVGLIVIDYLQLLLNSKTQFDTRAQELSEITRSLKNIAKEFQVPIIALSQLSRNVENRINKRPVLSDLRESGSIEQDADLVLMLYRENYYNINNDRDKKINISELIIAKHRNGPLGTVKLIFQSDPAKFFSNFIN
uniref:Replicative DNA helicase n=1 Tax=Roundia cardiophora TaxID=1403802 RepID=A0A089VPE5_9STRA|nr:DNA replication helicase [Roundia cardiophora]AIR75833.1 DNA replication helicase [Roundia cardiophora]